MPNTLTLAVAQLKAGPTSPEVGVRRHLKIIEKAQQRGVDLLVFPELSLTGYSLNDRVPDVALSHDDDLILKIANEAVGITVTFGFIEVSEGALYYNSVMTVRDGTVLNLHRKINLATYGLLEEGKHFAQGEEVNSFSLGEIAANNTVPTCRLESASWCACALICADHWNPLLLSLAAIRGANLLLAPIASATEAVGGEFSNPHGWQQNLGNSALTFGSYILMSNWVGHQDNINFWGGSCIVSPQGKVLTAVETQSIEQAEGKVDDCLITAVASYSIVKKARYLLPTLRDLDPYQFVREITRKT
ncbi:nitrilase-related carbon-nitrogen hydrolase [Kiloniella antarctica]|uniref:Nitrilase-related carbon-nitrogen hydrolase n=1 Tax=Kiloniella antarctica TaxID=1550907 RepID=A0ABW5BNJ6_9PROT